MRHGSHSGAGRQRGDAHPRQESPVDLRLVIPALAAWGAAALAVGVPGWATLVGVTLCLALAVLLLAPVAIRVARGTRRPRTSAAPITPQDRAGGTGGRWRLSATALAAVLLCAAAGATAAGLHSADQRRGPLPLLAAAHQHATVELTVEADPKLTRPRTPGDSWASRALLIDAESTAVTSSDGVITRTRNPVLVVVRPGLSAAVLARWQGLLPSTRLRLPGQLAPPLDGDHRYAAVLRVRGADPHIVGGPTALQRMAGDLRAGLREASDPLASDPRALLPGFIVGDTTRVTPDLQSAFEATDLTHLLAVSGSNLSVVLILLIGPPGRALLAERGGLAPRLGITLRGTALLGGALTLAFVIVCRPEPSVLRAAACGAIVLLAIGTGRRRSLIPALAAAVLLLVLYDPRLARNYGFLLSVLATGSLLTIAPGWSAALQRRGVPPRFAEALAAAAAAQAVCAPVVAVFAGRVSLVAVPCNLFAELAIAPATVLGFAALATAPMAMPLAESLARVAGWPTGWIASVARIGASLPGAQMKWQEGWWGGLLLTAVTALVVLILRRLRHHPWTAAVLAGLLVIAVLRPVPLARLLTGWPPSGWTVALCDVGQGDAMVLAAGAGRAVVVDVGPDPEPVDRCLRDLGITSIPLVLLTHFHADHVRGLPGVLQGRTVGAVQTTALEEPPEQSAFVRAVASRAQVPLIRARMGERRKVGRLAWQVLWPRLRGPSEGVGAARPGRG
ncbi:ComEC/Rec2 family competence protein, partial [Streptomyces sp. CWNU-1]